MSKSYKGGYKIVDLGGVDLTTLSAGGTISGIHKSIESSWHKALLLSGIVIAGVEKNDVYIEELKVVSGSYVIKAYGYEITITSDDEVTAIEITPKKIDVHEDVKMTFMDLDLTEEVTLYQLVLFDDSDNSSHLTPLVGKKLVAKNSDGYLRFSGILSYNGLSINLTTSILEVTDIDLTGYTFEVYDN